MVTLGLRYREYVLCKRLINNNLSSDKNGKENMPRDIPQTNILCAGISPPHQHFVPRDFFKYISRDYSKIYRGAAGMLTLILNWIGVDYT